MTRFMHSTALSGLALMFAIANVQPVHAEQVTDTLGTIIVAASRSGLTEDKIGRAHTVITGDALEKSQVRHVADALRRVPGFAVSRTGGEGGLTQIRVRGAEGNHVLVLIDGIEVSATGTGEYDFGGLQAADIERIEILRGPQSALWGANAMAGVISIVTKSGKRDGKVRSTLQGEFGTDGTRLGRVSVSGGKDRVDYAFSALYNQNNGYNIATSGTEKDGNVNFTLNGKVNYDITPDLTLNTSLRFVNRQADIDGFNFTTGRSVDRIGDYTKTKEFYGAAGLTWSTFDGNFIQKLQGKIATTDQESRGPFGLSGNRGSRYNLSYQGSIFFDTPKLFDATHTLTGAVEWKRETYRNTFPANFAPAQRLLQIRDMIGYVAEYNGVYFDRLALNGALRYDQNKGFKNALTYSVSGSLRIDETNSRLHASIGTGVTNPTFSELFGWNPGTFRGNPNLKPESSFGWDIGFEQRFFDDRLKVDVTYFNETLRDEIVTRFSGGMSSPLNQTGKSKRRGIEVSASFKLLENLTGTASYTYLIARNPDRSVEVRRPKHSGALNLTYGFLDGKASVFTDVTYNGTMQDLEFNPATPQTRATLKDYVLVNIGGDYKVNDTLTLYGRVENVFNTKYQEILEYRAPGIRGYVGFKATF